MDINVSQVGQNFASAQDTTARKVSEPSELAVESSKQDKLQAKDLSVAAEKEIQSKVSIEDIESAVSQLSQFVQTSSRQLNFSIDEDSQKQVVKVTDAESGQIIRQIPSEEVLELSGRLQDLQTDVGTAVGLLFNKQV
jgi:flagellar protein FlaG